MKKALVLKIIIFITFFIIIIILSSRQINKLKYNTKIKKALISEKEVTTIDITNLKNNNNLEHEHVYITMYDENNHWQECKVCRDKNNITGHTYTSSWTMGTANNCHNDNVLVKSCQCGYSYNSTEGRKQHSRVVYINNGANFTGYNQCNDCISWWNLHKCYKSDGSRINCLNLGKCSICNYNHTSNTHYQ